MDESEDWVGGMLAFGGLLGEEGGKRRKEGGRERGGS